MAEAESIKVAVRVRPLNKREKEMNDVIAVRTLGGGKMEVFKDDALKEFSFDYCYGIDSDQQTVMTDMGNVLLTNVGNGYNACIFAYGQTGAGKSWSVMGNKAEPELRGLLPRICSGMFEKFNNDPEVGEFKVICAYLEIYNEQMKDLLVAESPKLDIRKHPVFGIHVPHLTECEVNDFEEVDKLLNKGAGNRNVAATAMNAESSRSHAVFTLTTHVTMKDKRTRRAELHIVDLAGSERQKKTEASGARLKEGAAINQSLTVLGQVIFALGASQGDSKKGGKEHVPFRNSKLTYLLSDCLSGNSKTVMIAACSPAANNFDETLSTLRFAQSVKKIKTSVHKNEAASSDPQEIIKTLRAEIEELKKQSAMGIRRASLSGDVGEASVQIASMKHEMSVKRRQTMIALQCSPGEMQALIEEEEEDDDEESKKEKYNGFAEQLVEYIKWSLDVPVDWAFLDSSQQFLNSMDKKRKKDCQRAEDFRNRLMQLQSDVEQANFLCAWMMEHNYMPKGEAQSKWRVGIAWHINEEAPQLEGTLQAMFQQRRDDGSELILSSYDEEEFSKIRGALEEHYESCEKDLNEKELHSQKEEKKDKKKKTASFEEPAAPEPEAAQETMLDMTAQASEQVAQDRRGRMNRCKTMEIAKGALADAEQNDALIGSTRLRAESNMRTESAAEEKATLQQENEALVEQMESMRVNNQTLRSKNDELAAAHKSLLAQLEAAQAQVAAANAEINKLRTVAAAAPPQQDNGGGKPVTIDLYSKAVADEVPSGGSTPRGTVSPRRSVEKTAGARSPALSRAGSMKSDVVERVAGPDVKKIGLSFRTPPPGKLLIEVVDAGSWAAEAGFGKGDEILEINGTPCVAMPTDDFRRTMKDVRPIRFKVAVRPSTSSTGKASPPSGGSSGYAGAGSGKLSPPGGSERPRPTSPRQPSQTRSPSASQSMTSPRSPASPATGNAKLSQSLQARPAAQRQPSRSASRGPK